MSAIFIGHYVKTYSASQQLDTSTAPVCWFTEHCEKRILIDEHNQ